MAMESFYMNVTATYTEQRLQITTKIYIRMWRYGPRRGVGWNDEGISCHELDLDRGA